jgi:diguanylate cyclase (GGDEF)-like protein
MSPELMMPRTQAAASAGESGGLLRLFTLFEHMPGIAAVSDCDGRLLSMNQTGRMLCDLGRHASLEGLSLLDHYSPASREILRLRAYPAAMRNGVWCGETELAAGRGQSVPLWQVTAFQRGTGTSPDLLATLAWDVSSRKEMERNLWHQATHDALTGLPNRALLMDRLTQAIHGAQRTAHFTAVLLMDVNGFKAINDTHGHEIGNQVLAELAVRMYSCVRACDTVGRYGGDEFVFILCELRSSGEVEQVMQRIRTALETPFIAGPQRLRVGASIGVAIHPDHGEDAASLLHHADQTMYRAKMSHAAPLQSHERAVPKDIGPTVNCAV